MVVRQQSKVPSNRLKWSYFAVIGGSSSLFLVLIVLLASPWITYRGVPVDILLQFVQDPIARDAYFAKDKKALHDRLDQLGVEEEVKAFYRPQIKDERELDRYIHQLLYQNTGYIGNGYAVDAQGQLALQSTLPPDFWEWFYLAQKLQIVKKHKIMDDVMYVITPEGTRIPYSVISGLYSIPEMKKWLADLNTH